MKRKETELPRADELSTLADVDGEAMTVSSDDAFPYQVYDVEIPEAAGADSPVRMTWSSSANSGAQVILSVLNADGAAWTEVARHRTTVDDEQFSLEASVEAGLYAVDGTVTVLVQHSEGFAGQDLSERNTPVTPHNAQDVPRSEYDFTFAWESDTHYYNEQYYDHQLAIHDYLLDQRDELNLQYVFHTGDIVDDYDQEYQWQNADPQYARFDAAGLPYGVLAGNHDVGQKEVDYTNSGRYFGEARYASNPWYGGSYQNNRGHYC